MKNAVKDLVLRMTGGNAAVAEICAAVVSDVEEGNVCCRVGAEELKTLAAEPSVACFVDASSDAPFALHAAQLVVRAERGEADRRDGRERIG